MGEEVRVVSRVSVQTNFHVACKVGRLIEIRPEPLHSVDDVAALGNAIRAVVRRIGTECVGCVDFRRLRLLAPEIADGLVEVMKNGGTVILRSAALIGDHATFGLQIERIMKAANHPARRAFRDPNDLLGWLAEVTSVEEQARARQFLLET